MGTDAAGLGTAATRTNGWRVRSGGRIAGLRRLVGMALAALTASIAGPAGAGEYPSRPIHLIVPFSAGGATDVFARALGQKLNEAWGQPVVVENKPGAGGNIGANAVAKAAPDGYTLLMGAIGTNAVNASLYPEMPYDTAKDFQPITQVASVPMVVVVHPDARLGDGGEIRYRRGPLCRRGGDGSQRP